MMQEITLLSLRDIHRASLPKSTSSVHKLCFQCGLPVLCFLSFHDLVLFLADPPRVYLDSLNFPDNMVTVVAGNKLRLEIPISGEPAPRVVWMKGERVSFSFSEASFLAHSGEFVTFVCLCLSFQVILESGHRVRAETYVDQTSLTIEITEREDTGNYKIVLQNEAGEATASIRIKVVGKKSQNIQIKDHRENWNSKLLCS